MIAQSRTSPTPSSSVSSSDKPSSPLALRKDRLVAKAVDAAQTVASRYSGYKSTLKKMWQRHTIKKPTTVPTLVTPSNDGTTSADSDTDDSVDSTRIERSRVTLTNTLTPPAASSLTPPATTPSPTLTLQRNHSFTCGEHRRNTDVTAKTARQLHPTTSLPRSRSETKFMPIEKCIEEDNMPEPSSPIDKPKPVDEQGTARRLVTSAKACTKVKIVYEMQNNCRLLIGVSLA
jgi:hypothetical protein